jgi:hypothetical protein
MIPTPGGGIRSDRKRMPTADTSVAQRITGADAGLRRRWPRVMCALSEPGHPHMDVLRHICTQTEARTTACYFLSFGLLGMLITREISGGRCGNRMASPGEEHSIPQAPIHHRPSRPCARRPRLSPCTVSLRCAVPRTATAREGGN